MQTSKVPWHLGSGVQWVSVFGKGLRLGSLRSFPDLHLSRLEPVSCLLIPRLLRAGPGGGCWPDGGQAVSTWVPQGWPSRQLESGGWSILCFLIGQVAFPRHIHSLCLDCRICFSQFLFWLHWVFAAACGLLAVISVPPWGDRNFPRCSMRAQESWHTDSPLHVGS